MTNKPLENLIFLDEAGAHLGMLREYGRAMKGERLIDSCPYPRGSKFSMLSAVSISEVTSALYTKGSVNGEIFLHFIEHYLAPKLKPGHFVILDNVSFHKVAGVQKAVESRGAQLIYLPPYSPDLSPIENMWSKVKNSLRNLGARCEETFKSAIKTAFLTVTSADLKGWYQHCGYKGSIYI